MTDAPQHAATRKIQRSNPSCSEQYRYAHDVRLVRFRTYHCGPKNTVASLRFAFVNSPGTRRGGSTFVMRLAVTSGELLRAIKEETMRLPFAPSLALALFSTTST